MGSDLLAPGQIKRIKDCKNVVYCDDDDVFYGAAKNEPVDKQVPPRYNKFNADR